MKLEALDHPKTLDFASRLGVTLPTAIGHLELLWAFTGKKSPQGNVGKWPNGAISMACYWAGPSEQFIQALLDAGFLDTHSDFRLLIHDWRDHAPNWVKAKLIKLKLSFLDVRSPVPTAVATPVPTAVATPVGSNKEAADEKVPTGEPTAVATAESSSRARAAPREAKGSEAYTVCALQNPLQDSSQIEAEIQSTYPPCNGARKWLEALRSCRQQVEEGEATWPQLLESTRSYRQFVDAGGVSGPSHVLTPQNFFAAADKLWQQRRELPKSKAEKRLAGNISAAEEFLRRTELKA